MVTATSFKQQCPSCEAMVPIKDKNLIGRKIDCPKCKYRFVVELPADVEAADEDEKVVPAAKKNGKATAIKKGPPGKAKLKVTVLGDGSVAKYEQQGDFTDTPTGKCIDAAVGKLQFPRTKKPKQSFGYPIVLQ